MINSLLLMLVIGGVFGSLIFVYKYTTKINCKYSENNIGKVVASFPVSYKMSGYIVRIGDKYYFCCEGCGIVEIDYSGNLDKVKDNPSFQAIVAKQLERINKIKNTKNIKNIKE